MAVLKMQRVTISALKKDRKSILEKLQALGIMEMHQVEPEGFSCEDTVSARQDFESDVRKLEQALSVLDEYAPEKASVFSSLEGKEIVERKDFDPTIEDASDELKAADSIIDLSKEMSEKKAELQRIANERAELLPWKDLGVPLKKCSQDTEKTSLIVGIMGPEMDQDKLYEIVSECQEDGTFDVNILEKDQDATFVSVICMKDDEEAIEGALRANSFSWAGTTSDKAPHIRLEELGQEEEKANKEIDEIAEKIKSFSGERESLKRTSDYYRMRSGKYEVIGELPESEHSFIVSGFVAEKNIDVIRSAIEENYDCVIDIDEAGEDEDVPTVLSNNEFSSSVEGVVQSYGLPSRKEFDPTTIMSFFYVFFFGLMLSDAAYGIVMTIVCFILVNKFKNMGEGMRKQLKLFMYCGISTTFWGIMFGGYFGDVITVVAKTFFDKDVTVPALWFTPIEDPMRLLIWCLGFGIIHLFVGLAIKGYEELRDGKKLDFFCDVVLWYMFLIGLLLMLIPSEMFRSIAQIDVSFPPAVGVLAKVLTIAGLVGILLMSGRDHKNPVLRLALGAYDVYGVTSWLSDVLSYSRLLALGLATGVIASVVNQMGSMAGGGVIGAILFIVIFLIGHSMNMAINILGAYVHTNRLQFVEFFGKFYDGGGRPIEPFEQKTKYVEVKEEM